MTDMNLYVSNITKSINLIIKCNQLTSILSLKKIIAKQINTSHYLFRLTNGKNLEENLDAPLSTLNIHDEDRIFIMNKLDVERAVLEEWYRLDGFNWEQTRYNRWCIDSLNQWHGVCTNDQGKVDCLRLAYMNISLVPPGISQLKYLKVLSLHGNRIKTLPPEISQLQNLTALRIDENKLSSIPIEICKLKKLEILTMGENNISVIPPELSQLKNLERLELYKNNISKVPSELLRLKKLKRLLLHTNNISCMPYDFLKDTDDPPWQELSYINLAVNNIKHLSPNLKYFKNMTCLHFGTNKITDIPVEISQLTNLEFLNFSRNKISHIPLEFSKLKKLETLQLEETNVDIKSLPSEIRHLPKVRIYY